MLLRSLNSSTSLPTSTSGSSVRSIMHMSMHMLPRCGAKPFHAAKLHLFDITRGRPSAYPMASTPMRVRRSVT